MNIKYHINKNMTTLYHIVLTLRIMRLAHEPADAAGICRVANHTADLIQDAYGDNRFKEPLALAFIYESATPELSLGIINPFPSPFNNYRGFLFCQGIQYLVLF